jgi:hypothetical protein
MREELARQVEQKKLREQMEKAHIDEQARMWALDRKNYENQERALNDKIRQINHENRQFLESQM